MIARSVRRGGLARRADAAEADLTVRTTLELDEELLLRLRRFVPPRGLSRFLNQALAEKIALLEQRERESNPAGWAARFEPEPRLVAAGAVAELADGEQPDSAWYALDPEGWSE